MAEVSTPEIIKHFSNIREEIGEIESRIGTLISQNSYSSPEFSTLQKTLTKKQDILENILKLQKVEQEITDTQLLREDDALAEIAEEELSRLNSLRTELFKFFEKATMVELPDDEKKVLLEFRPGVGGTEASIFAEDLFRLYSRYLTTAGLRPEVLELEYDDQGIKQAVIFVDTPGAFGQLRFESGVFRVQRIPATESAGRIHTSTASIVVLPEYEKTTIDIPASDLRIDVYRSSGPGGQSVNTTDSAVRITHIPTGITVSCQNGKSQHKNKDTAMKILMSKLQAIETEKSQSQEKQIRSGAIKDGDRSSKIRTFNFQQSRVTDHRINQSWYNLEEIMNGEIGEIVETVNLTLRRNEE